MKIKLMYLMSLFYIYVGINHFIDPDWFMQIMPPYLPFHRELVLFSGLIEIILGLFLLLKPTRSYAAWGLIILLICVFPANIYLAQTNGEAMNISPLIAWGRLPFQFIFIYIAYLYTKV